MTRCADNTYVQSDTCVGFLLEYYYSMRGAFDTVIDVCGVVY